MSKRKNKTNKQTRRMLIYEMLEAYVLGWFNINYITDKNLILKLYLPI